MSFIKIKFLYLQIIEECTNFPHSILKDRSLISRNFAPTRSLNLVQKDQFMINRFRPVYQHSAVFTWSKMLNLQQWLLYHQSSLRLLQLVKEWSKFSPKCSIFIFISLPVYIRKTLSS